MITEFQGYCRSGWLQYVVWGGVLLLLTLPAASQAIRTLTNEPVLPLTAAHLALYEDPGGTATFAQVQADTSLFRPSDAFPAVAGRDYTSIWWLRLRLYNATSSEKTWWVNLAGDEVAVWQVDAATGGVTAKQTGFLRARAEKPVPLRRTPWLNYVPITLAAGASADVIARIDHRSRRLSVMRDPGAVLTPLYARWQLREAQAKQGFQSGFFQALFLLLICYSLGYYVYTRETFALYLAGYGFFLAAHLLLLEGYLYAWLLHPRPILQFFLGFGLTYASYACIVPFALHFTNLDTLLPRWARFYRRHLIFWHGAVGCGVLGLLAATLNYQWVESLHSGNVLFGMIGIGLIYSLRLLMLRDTMARLYGLASLLLNLGALTAILGFAFNLTREALYFWYEVSTALFVLIITVGLSIRAGRHRQAQQQAETEKARAEERSEAAEHVARRLREVNEAQARFLANISHEFRTPLTLTFGPLDDLLTGRFQVEAAARPHLERARRNGHRLLRLINQLLDLSRLDAGAVSLAPERADLVGFLRQRVAIFESLAAERGLQLAFLPEKAQLLHGFDPEKLETVVLNLLSNACKFTPRGGSIIVQLEADAAGHAIIQVRDTGIGIAADHLPHLFDRFYQVDSTMTRPHEGTGIGLSLARQLVVLHGGTLSVESTVGVGTTFTVTLPPMDAPEAAPRPATEAPELGGDGRAGLLEAAPADAALSSVAVSERPRVLVVEDNDDMRAYIRGHLEADFVVTEVPQGLLGLEAARAEVPDLILSDVMMPVMDGLALLAALREDARTSHIPVVLLSAKADVASRITGLETGADAYLAKPFHAAELQATLHTLIKQRRKLHAALASAGPAAIPANLPPREADFLEQAQAVIHEHLSDTHFGVDQLAEALALSARQLSRKLSALLGTSPHALIRETRLRAAARLLEERPDLSVKAVAAAVGFRNPSYFTQVFRTHFGVAPSAYTAA